MARQEFKILQFERKRKYFKAGVSGVNFHTELGVL